MGRPDVFRDDEVSHMRRALDQLRSELSSRGSYEPGRWMVSALNRRPDVVGGFVEDVVVRDITLRTTEQMAGVSIVGSDRLKFLDALARAGVRSVQPSAFRRGETVERMRAEVDAVRSVNPTCEIVYGGATSANHVQGG